MSLNQYVSHDFDVLVSIIWCGLRFNATRVGVTGAPEPNPILESQEKQSPSLLPMIPIFVLGRCCKSLSTLKPSRLRLCCKELWEPSRLFHVLRLAEVGQNCPSAINECSDLALWSMVIKFVVSLPGIFMPRQIFENGLLQ